MIIDSELGGRNSGLGFWGFRGLGFRGLGVKGVGI